MATVFTNALLTPGSPSIVAQKILAIYANGTWQLRHPTGPDAVPLLQWRSGMTGEEWVDLHSSDDEEYFRRMERDSTRGASPTN